MPLINLPQPHFNESIREVNENSWLISNTLLLTPLGGIFALSTAPKPLPDSKPLTEDSSPISRVHAVDNQVAVWRAGEAFIKAHHMDYPHVTREHVTRQFLKIADGCNHLAAWKGDIIGGVDGHQLLERYLVKGNSKMADALSPQQLLKN
ncbi:hypothetical protein BDV30DRAFT_236138 [Aspergillus minisclerotigenes]|uniref:Uncharacterized protein n=1 Tax=Aspergillus minisclerotigenes TaxID=656917 RepID=A0A5N6JD12_9EURO|nr:hypothetical protein BDV30DRAFT_236138 [Aspergillus minisclerotigenes]